MPQDQDGDAPLRNVLLTLLTLGTGAVDATSFVSAGHVFSSVITGNLVVLGVSAGWHGPILGAGVALAAYAAGVAAGASTGKRDPHRGVPWPWPVTVTLAIELTVLAAFSIGWEFPAARSGGWQLVLLALLAGAMGLQSTAVRRLGQVSTTYLTSTLTALVTSAVTGEDRMNSLRSLVLLSSIIAGAVCAAVTLHLAPGVIPVLVAGPIAVVVMVATLRSRHGPAAG